MNPHPKILLGIAIIITVIFSLYLLLRSNKSQFSSINITPAQNKFKVSFEIINKDQENLPKFLQKLKISSKISQGFEFELDSTSSAKLAFSSPVVSRINFEGNKVKFWGATTQLLFNQKVNLNKNLKLPPTLSIVIFANDLIPQASTTIKLSAPLENWLNENFPRNGQYLLIFASNDVALIATRSQSIDFTTLESQKVAGQQQSPLKQEVQDNRTFYLLKVPDSANNETTLTFFESADFVAISTSKDVANQFLDLQQGNSASLEIEPGPNNTALSLMIFLQNNDGRLPEAVTKILDDDQKSQNFVKNVKGAKLTLIDNNFQGYIETFD